MHISHYPYHIHVNERLKVTKRFLLDCVLFSLFSCYFLQGRKPILLIDYMHDVSAVKPNCGSGQRGAGYPQHHLNVQNPVDDWKAVNNRKFQKSTQEGLLVKWV